MVKIISIILLASSLACFGQRNNAALWFGFKPPTSGGGIVPNSEAFWYLNANYNDSSGNGVSLSPTGSPTFASDDNGFQALSLNGSSQYAQATLPYSAAITITAWIKCPSFGAGGAYSAIVTYEGSGNVDIIVFAVNSSGKLLISINTAANTSQSSYNGTGANTLSVNTWYFVAFTYDSVNGLIGYVNASVDGTAAASGMITSLSPVTNVGCLSRAVSATAFDGLIQDVRVYNVALPATGTTSIASLYAGLPQ